MPVPVGQERDIWIKNLRLSILKLAQKLQTEGPEDKRQIVSLCETAMQLGVELTNREEKNDAPKPE